MFSISYFSLRQTLLTLLSASVLAVVVAPQPVQAARKSGAKSGSTGKKHRAPKTQPFVLYENWEGLSTQALVDRANAISKSVGLQDSDALIKVLLQETRLGRLGGFWRAAGRGLKSEPYYGIGQMKLTTAMDVLKSEPRWLKDFKLQPDEDLIRAHLTINDRFSATMAAVYLKQLSRQYQGDALLNAYNRGPAGVKGVTDDFHYAVAANEKFYEVFPEKKPLVVTAADCQPVVAAQTLATSIGPALGTGTAPLGTYDPGKDPLMVAHGKPAAIKAVEKLDVQVKTHARGGKPVALSSDPRFAEACARLSLVATASDVTVKAAPGKSALSRTVVRR